MSKTHLSEKEFKERLEQHLPNQFKLVTPFQGMSKPITVRCNTCQHKWHAKQARYLLQISQCKYCHQPKIKIRHKANRQVPIPNNLKLKPGEQLTAEKFIQRFEATHPGRQIKIISSWKGSKEPAVFKCLNCGNKWTIKPNDLQHRKIGCPKCAQKKRYQTMYTPIEIVKDKINQKYGYNKYQFLSTYHGTNKSIKVKCNDCGHIFTTKASHLYTNNCPVCSSTNRRLPIKELQRRINNTIGPNKLTVKGQYINYSTKFQIECNTCHRLFFTKMANIINNKEQCPFCAASKREKEIMELLDQNNIDYQFQYRTKSLKSSKNHPMHLDFYIKEIHTAIEHDGEQHFSSTWQGVDAHKELKQRDDFKNKWCQAHHIKLIRIKYNEDLITKLTPIFTAYKNKKRC